MVKEELNFYDVKYKDKFLSSDYEIVTKGKRYFAVCSSNKGKHKCWRIISKAHALKSV